MVCCLSSVFNNLILGIFFQSNKLDWSSWAGKRWQMFYSLRVNRMCAVFIPSSEVVDISLESAESVWIDTTHSCTWSMQVIAQPWQITLLLDLLQMAAKWLLETNDSCPPLTLNWFDQCPSQFWLPRLLRYIQVLIWQAQPAKHTWTLLSFFFIGWYFRLLFWEDKFNTQDVWKLGLMCALVSYDTKFSLSMHTQ